MKYDFAHPKFKNGMVTFDEKKPDLLRIFREVAIRRHYTLRPDMYLYNQAGDRLARVENYGHMLLVTSLGDYDMGSHRIHSKNDIVEFFGLYESTRKEIHGMRLDEAVSLLKENGYNLF